MDMPKPPPERVAFLQGTLKSAAFGIWVEGKVGPREIDHIINILEVQRAVLEDDDAPTPAGEDGQ